MTPDCSEVGSPYTLGMIPTHLESFGQRPRGLEKMIGVHPNVLHLPVLFDLLGVSTAAASGALAGVRKGLDLIGVLVPDAVTGLGGGAVRDLMIGATPPAMLAGRRYLTTATAASAAVLAAESRMPPATAALRVVAVHRGWNAQWPAVRR